MSQGFTLVNSIYKIQFNYKIQFTLVNSILVLKFMFFPLSAFCLFSTCGTMICIQYMFINYLQSEKNVRKSGHRVGNSLQIPPVK